MELVELIAEETGISIDEACEVLNTVSGFMKEKYPLMALTVDTVLGTGTDHCN